MNNYGGNNYQKILNYIDIIQRNPKEGVKYFYFDDGKKFIVDGSMLKLIPLEYHRFNTKDEFYIHINPIEKVVMYYAFDIENFNSGKHINESEGFIEWDQIEDCIYNFFVINIKQLSSIMTPYVDVQNPSAKSTSSASSSSSSSSSSHNTSSSFYNSSPYSYGTPAYKEREAFFEGLWASLKENKSTKAIDLIHSQMEKMVNEKKYEELDIMLKMISFDKLNIPTMLEILDTTRTADNSLKERKEFFNKVKTHLAKMKPARAKLLLKRFESDKEVVDLSKN